jgi:uracil-DNA glycosylase
MEIDLDDIKLKLIEKLRPSGWADKLKGFLNSSDFEKILLSLYNSRETEGKRFTPPLKNVFRSFEECPWDQLKVVIIGQDPYPTIYTADGIAFSCGLTQTAQPSLQYIFDALQNEGVEHSYNPDLTRWANQGVLLLNYALTCEIGKPGTHYNLWEDFMAYALDIINSYHRGLVFIFMGKKAQELAPLIGDQHHKIFTSHPASALYSGSKTWDSKGCFTEVNQILMEQTKDHITW